MTDDEDKTVDDLVREDRGRDAGPRSVPLSEATTADHFEAIRGQKTWDGPKVEIVPDSEEDE